MDRLAETQSTVHGMWPTVFEIASGTPLTSASYSTPDPPVHSSIARSRVYRWSLCRQCSEFGRMFTMIETSFKNHILSTSISLSSTFLVARRSTVLRRCVRLILMSYSFLHRTLMSCLSDMKSMTGILEHLVYLSSTRNLLYVTDTTGTSLKPTYKFEHLSCFFPGLLALGAATLPESIMSKQQRELHMWAAEGLAHTCWIMYAEQPSGLGAEVVMFDGWRIYTDPQSSGDWNQQRWMEHVRRWEQDGRIGGKPPGVGNASLPRKFKDGLPMDYMLLNPNYLLRPEVRIHTPIYLRGMFNRLSSIDLGVYVCVISNNQGCQVAGAWLANMGGH